MLSVGIGLGEVLCDVLRVGDGHARSGVVNDGKRVARAFRARGGVCDVGGRIGTDGYVVGSNIGVVDPDGAVGYASHIECEPRLEYSPGQNPKDGEREWREMADV